MLKTATTDGCAVGQASAGNAAPVSATSCVSGRYEGFGSFDFTGPITVQGCYEPTSGTRRCIETVVPEPV
ncbi:MAG TPA: hypothetical protein VF755_17955 [Catenuloplanes sp.]